MHKINVENKRKNASIEYTELSSEILRLKNYSITQIIEVISTSKSNYDVGKQKQGEFSDEEKKWNNFWRNTYIADKS